MNFDNEMLTKDLNHTIIKKQVSISYHWWRWFRPVYLLVTLTAHSGQRVYDGEDWTGLYHYKFVHDFDYPILLYKFTKGDWSEVEIDSAGNRTENRSTKKHTGIKKEHD
jgi:hypothetical protein